MQTVTQILEHLQKLPEEFAEQYAAGEYARAASTHEYAARVSSFIEMDKDARDALMARFNQVQVEDAYQRVGRWRDAERERVGKEAFRAGDHYISRKEYLQAALCADWAAMIALFCGADEELMVRLFGTRQTDEPIEGLIRADRRMKADEWCIYKGGYAHSKHTYQNVMTLA